MTEYFTLALILAAMTAYCIFAMWWFRKAIKEAANDPIDFDQLKLKNYGK